MATDEVRTFCRVCEAACGLVAERDADGTPVRLRPDRDHPHSQGYACAKGTRFLEVARHPSRVLTPRIDGKPATWPEALATAASRLTHLRRRFGPHAIGLYFGNPIAFNGPGLAALLAFIRGMGSRNVFSASSQDCNNKFAGAKLVHGSPAIHPVPDFERCELAVVFGSNPYVSQSSFVHLPRGATVFDRIVERGGDVFWIDPRRTESARRCGTHVPIRPGTDAWLMLALLGLLAQQAPRDRRGIDGADTLLAHARAVTPELATAHTGVPAATITALADRIARARATAFHMSVGVNQGGFGTLAYVLLHALAWASGNLDREGGSLLHPLGHVLARVFGAGGLDPHGTSRVGAFESLLGTLPGGILADEILQPGPGRLRGLIVIAGDPVRSIPGGERLERAFASLDTLVSIDMFDNTSSRHADVFLPSASWLERADVSGTSVALQAGGLIQMTGPVMAPMGEARNDARILADVAIAMGSRNPLWWLARLPWPQALTRTLARALPPGLRGPAPRPGRWRARHTVRLWHPRLDDELQRLRALAVDDASGRFTLIGRRRRLGHNGWLHGGVRDGNPDAYAAMAAEDLAALSLAEGDLVDIATSSGTLTLPVRAEAGLARGTVVVPHGLPQHNLNALVPSGEAAIERLSGQHVMTGVPARVRAAAREIAAGQG